MNTCVICVLYVSCKRCEQVSRRGEGSGADWLDGRNRGNEVPQYWAELLPVLLADQQRMREQAAAGKPLGAMEASNLDDMVQQAMYVHQVAALYQAHRELEALYRQVRPSA